jgi:hypothetical protein
MNSFKPLLLLASLLVTAAPALADDLGPPCTPVSPVHEEPNGLTGAWRFVVAAAGHCNQFIMTFKGDAISTAPVQIEPYSFAGGCPADMSSGKPVMGVAGVKGKVGTTYCYNSPTTKALFRMHQFVLYNDDPNRPYVASYVVWDDGKFDGQSILKGTGSDSSGSAVNVWLLSETK